MSAGTVRLKFVANVRVSTVDKKSNDDELPVRLCNYTDVYYNPQIDQGLDFMEATATEEQAQRFRLRRGQTLITKDSESPEDIGVAAFVDVEDPGVLCGYHLAQIEPDPSKTDPKFLFWAIRSQKSAEHFTLGASGVTRFGLRTDTITGLPILLPSAQEQRRIADFLDVETARIDALIAAKRQMIRVAARRFEAFVTASTLQLDRAPLKRLAAVIDCKHRTPDYEPDGYPVVSPGDVLPGRLDLSRCHRFVNQRDWEDLTEGARRPRVGDIVYSRNASVGLAALVESDPAFCMGQDVCLVRPLRSDGDGRFLLHTLNTVGLAQINELKIGSTFFRINVAQIAEINVPIAAEAEQDALVGTWERQSGALRALTSTLSRQIDLLRERRQALITAAVSGELDL